MKPSLQVKLSQHLALTPQLQQSIRLLQLSSLELQQEINQMLADNPLLELAEPLPDDMVVPAAQLLPQDSMVKVEAKESSDDAPVDLERGEMGSDDAPETDREPAEEWPSSPERGDDDDQTFDHAISATLRDHLLQQVGTLRHEADIITLVTMMVEAIDEAGFLGVSRDEVNFMLTEASGEIAPQVSTELWDAAITVLHRLDPPGVGARSLQECLALQLKLLPESVPQVDALAIVEKLWDALTTKDSGRIKRVLQMEEEDFRAAVAVIQSCSTRPGAAFADDAATFVVPDILVKKVRRRWVAQLNPATMPKLRINHLYANILAENKSGRSTPLSPQLQEARWLIKNVEQRFATVLRVGTSIVERQQSFFEHGDIAMRPLTLREIAEELDLHESTISRVTSSKYMYTPRGVFELKYFFGSGVSTDTGGSASATAIKAMIKQLITDEDAKKPLNDSTLAELLEAQGVLVARRTVAKYREMLGVPPVSERRTR